MFRSVFKYIKDNPGSIIVMIVLTIIIALFQPIIDLLRSAIVTLLLNTSAKYSDYLFMLAARNDPNLLSELSASYSMLIFYSVIMLMLFYFKYTYEKHVGRDKAAKRSGAQTTSNHKRNIKVIILAGMLLSILMQLMIFFDWATYTSAHKIDLKFNNDVVILESLGKTNEVKKLRAEWVQMKSKNDYNLIYIKIESYEK